MKTVRALVLCVAAFTLLCTCASSTTLSNAPEFVSGVVETTKKHKKSHKKHKKRNKHKTHKKSRKNKRKANDMDASVATNASGETVDTEETALSTEEKPMRKRRRHVETSSSNETVDDEGALAETESKKSKKSARKVLYIKATITPQVARKACKYFGGKLVREDLFAETAAIMVEQGERRAHVGPHRFDEAKSHVLVLAPLPEAARTDERAHYTTLRLPEEGELLGAACAIPAKRYETAQATYADICAIIAKKAGDAGLAERPTAVEIARALRYYGNASVRPRKLFSRDHRAAQLIAELSLYHSDEGARAIAALRAVRSRIAAKVDNSRVPPVEYERVQREHHTQALKDAEGFLARENRGLTSDPLAVGLEKLEMALLDDAFAPYAEFDAASLPLERRLEYDAQLALLQAAFMGGGSALVFPVDLPGFLSAPTFSEDV